MKVNLFLLEIEKHLITNNKSNFLDTINTVLITYVSRLQVGLQRDLEKN